MTTTLRPALVSCGLAAAWWLLASGCDGDDPGATSHRIQQFQSVKALPALDAGAFDTAPPDASMGEDAGADTEAPWATEDVGELDAAAAPEVHEAPDAGPVEDAPPTCEEPAGDPDPDPVEQPGPGATEPTAPEGINLGFIGGACTTSAECGPDGAFCLEAGEGFPGGHCTLPCTKLCPDQAGAVTTFCVDPLDLGDAALGSDGLCIARCDYGVSPTGCRPGYGCKAVSRNGEAGTVVFACLPGLDGAYPLTACHEELIARGVSWSPGLNKKAVPAGAPNKVCDVVDPVWVGGVQNGVTYRYASASAAPKTMYASCGLALSMEHTAALLKEQGYESVIHLGVYNCRTISGTTTLSQHAFANAIDISGLVDGAGTVTTVYKHWEDGVKVPVTAAGSFLKWFVETLHADWIFHIILTPEYNAAHDDHFHCDLTPGAHTLK